MRKKVFFLAFLVGGVYLIVILSRDLWRILGSRKRIETAAKRVEELEQEQAGLKAELDAVDDAGFVEKEARDKLLLAKEGEVVVLLPKQIENGELRVENEMEEKDLANWEKWARLFIY